MNQFKTHIDDVDGVKKVCADCWCGGDGQLFCYDTPGSSKPEEYAVICEHCGWIGPKSTTTEGATIEWNRMIREPDDVPVDFVDGTIMDRACPCVVCSTKCERLDCSARKAWSRWRAWTVREVAYREYGEEL